MYNNKVWMTKHGKRLAAKRCQNAKKIIQAISFDREDIVLQFPITNKKSVKICINFNSNTKTNVQNWFQGLLLLRDNAPAHKSKFVTYFLSKDGIIVIHHPAYFSNISLLTFSFSQNLKDISWKTLYLQIITWVRNLLVCEGSA